MLFCNLFNMQEDFQNYLLSNDMYEGKGFDGATGESVELFSYHMQAMISELGEVLEADKRWKSFRNSEYDRRNKLEEIADCFITMMNVAIFSGYHSEELEEAIVEKINKNYERLCEELNDRSSGRN